MQIRKTVCGIVGSMLLLGAGLAPVSATAASIDGKFNAAISSMLMNMKDGPVAQMSKRERTNLVKCVQKIFGAIPDEKKQFILAAKGADEIRARFDKVGLENQAKLKKQVRDDCA